MSQYEDAICYLRVLLKQQTVEPQRQETLVDVQADLSLRWAHMSEGKFSQIQAHFIFTV